MLSPIAWLEELIHRISLVAPPGTYLNYEFNIRGLLAVILVSLICGAVGSLVVGNRMAFFSDALAHCAFAGIGLGFLIGLAAHAEKSENFLQVQLPLAMATFGIAIGISIAYVREKTGLASDTVIGVFFAGAIGLGALLLKQMAARTNEKIETYIFGDPLTIQSMGLVVLLGLVVITMALLGVMYNQMVFASFNPSLARSRRIPLRLCNYAFIILLALIVNLCFRTVGVLLINALLIVPAATAANLCRNIRQLFWTTIALCLLVGISGNLAAWEINMRLDFPIGIGGTIIVLSVLLFFLSMLLGPRLRGKQAY